LCWVIALDIREFKEKSPLPIQHSLGFITAPFCFRIGIGKLSPPKQQTATTATSRVCRHLACDPTWDMGSPARPETKGRKYMQLTLHGHFAFWWLSSEHSQPPTPPPPPRTHPSCCLICDCGWGDQKTTLVCMSPASQNKKGGRREAVFTITNLQNDRHPHVCSVIGCAPARAMPLPGARRGKHHQLII
jgi:hypothetical protein